MAATKPEIRVFAMFPHEPQSSDWHWVHCLTFPVETLQKLQFSHRPYKWIRYTTGVVVGAQGDLSLSSNSLPNVIDYDVALPSDSIDLYYHISDAEMQRMFPADPDAGHSNITSSVATPRRVDFRSKLWERDGRCVLTNFPVLLCDSVHLLPHNKGDEYIRMYTQKRGRDPEDIVNEIDSIRNGILLHTAAHRTLGLFIVFLMTPNFAMSTADIDPATSPTERRCTAHLFTPGEQENFGDSAVRPGSPVRMSANDWPPNILFDAVYANAVLRHFAAQTLGNALSTWKPTFYPRWITNATQADHHAILDERAAQQERGGEQKQARIARGKEREPSDDCDYFDVLVMLPYIVMPQDRREAIWRETEKKAEMERSKLEDKVVGWAEEVATARWP